MNEGRLRLTLATVPGDVGELLALLAPEEQDRAARFRSAATRAAYVATWAGLRILVAHEL